LKFSVNKAYLLRAVLQYKIHKVFRIVSTRIPLIQWDQYNAKCNPDGSHNEVMALICLRPSKKMFRQGST